jgi:hypothetical protein
LACGLLNKEHEAQQAWFNIYKQSRYLVHTIFPEKGVFLGSEKKLREGWIQ